VVIAAYDWCMSEPVRVIRAADLMAADPTSGMLRLRAFELPILWAGQVTTEPGAVSGWHHHDRNESSLYIVDGVLRLEFEGSDEYLDAVAGDFVHVPAFTVHRESNPGSKPSLAIIARAGGGIPTVNVDAPVRFRPGRG
jgi:quercetin dioxygenase-like cupin family protein